ncbi:hypothetical protein H072_9327 [Dactylellina haptotyla CBS 200.50]|uniref:SRPBCC family protein n=1 Tax=Dactylellina haptotyla (strain CBS 200.50) TaxID=1284197 RepID=S8A235_DACHA|nr:hypothetical protein H072_9327 [Dactylellina haptotyla CBS 200.50]
MSVSLPYETKIRAPIAEVWEFLINSENYPTLNPLCVENGPATITPATGAETPEKREWIAVEATTMLGGLYTHKITLNIVSTLTEPGKLMVHDIDSSAGGIVVNVTYALSEEEQERGSMLTILKDTITITAPWYLRGIAASTAGVSQKTRSQRIKDALDEK